MRIVLSLFLVFACLVLFTDSLLSQVLVSGSGSPEADGVYSDDGMSNGKPAYTSVSGPVRHIVWSGSEWRITDSGGETYYINSASSAIPPAYGWAEGTIGWWPVPMLSPQPVQPAGGTDEDHPYLIASLANLLWITATDEQVPSPNRAERWAADYLQTADIDASHTGLGGYWGSGWSPIGDADLAFSGGYNGDSYTITGLRVSHSPDYTGLFGRVITSKGLLNVGLIDADIVGFFYTGALAGEVSGTGFVQNCFSTGTVDGADCTGGLIGYVTGVQVFDSYSTAAVNGAEFNCVGGLAGYAENATLLLCHATGSVTGGQSTGGLVGVLYTDGVIVFCHSSGAVTGVSSFIGGLVGYAQSSTVDRSYSRGTVTGPLVIGGLIGNASGVLANDSYSLSTVTSPGKAGGLAGTILFSEMNRCYFAGSVTGTPVGGIAGEQFSVTASNLFWDTESSGQTTGPIGTGLTTAEMKTQSSFTDWDFTYVWQIVPGYYPQLLENPDGTLPVELSSFTAVAKGRGVELAWKTATELNNKGFEIQRKELNHRDIGSLNQSADGSMNQWHGIGFIAGNGTTNAPHAYSFVDNSASGIVQYRLKQVNNDGSFKYSDAVEVTVDVPSAYTLSQNHPNPFNPATTISYSLPSAGFVTLKVYDVLGKEVAVLVHELQNAGANKASFDASHLPSGIYFARLSSGSFNSVIKMTLMK